MSLAPRPALTRRLPLVWATMCVLALGSCADASEPQTAPSQAPPASPSASADDQESAEPSAEPAKEPKKTKEAADSVLEASIVFESGEVSPVAKKLETSVGTTLRINVRSDTAAELHVHTTPEAEFAITPGDASYDVALDRPGQVDVEDHNSGALLLRILVK